MSLAAANEEKHWKSIWKINAPGKMKIHLWRFAHDCLPSGVQLQRRQIPTSDACIFCGKVEDIEHSMLFCQFAQEVWRGVKATYCINLQRHQFLSLFDFLAYTSDLEATTLAVGCWYIWEARNDSRNNGTMLDPNRTAARIIAYIETIIQHCYKPIPGNMREASQTSRWSPPPPGVVLVNSDVAMFSDQRKMAMGAVIHGNSGECLTVASLPLQDFTSPELGEALALRGALAITRDKAFFASDCLSLIQRLNSPAPDRSLW
jgi:hypothetical protein